jgi:hypothetical protein
VGKASSAKKASRIAKSSGGRKVRSQQGLVFPVALVVVLTLGLALLIYGRATSHQDLGAPALNTNTQPGDHWHTAYGIYICDQYLPNMSVGVTPDPGGIHTHQDGVIHIHPFLSRAAGKNATVGLYFKLGGWKASQDSFTVWDGKTHQTGDKCGGKPCIASSGETSAQTRHAWYSRMPGRQTPAASGRRRAPPRICPHCSIGSETRPSKVQLETAPGSSP